MVRMKDLTLVTCSYNTPEVTMSMLRSFYQHHKNLVTKINLILMENSTNDYTVKCLEENNIPYIRNEGGTHSVSVDAALKKVKTRYALLTDTDVIYHKSINTIFNVFKTGKYASMGRLGESRGGYRLMPRIYPWFQFMDMEQINSKGISFHDQKRIEMTNSTEFFQNIPVKQNGDGIYYDVGSTFLQDLLSNGLTVASANYEGNIFTHYEGMSWQKNVTGTAYVKLGEYVEKRFLDDCKIYRHVNIKNRYK